jgi:hypothetical protein
MDGPHWRVAPFRDMDVFLLALREILPEGAALGLADGHPSRELRKFLETNAVACPTGAVPDAFPSGRWLPADRTTIAALAEMARRHAEPEVAEHVGVFAGAGMLLEWYDLPDDPISVAPDVPEERVAAFARSGGVSYTRIPG